MLGLGSCDLLLLGLGYGNYGVWHWVGSNQLGCVQGVFGGVYSVAHKKLPHLCLGLDLVRIEVVCAYCHFVLGWLGFGFEMDTGLWLR